MRGNLWGVSCPRLAIVPMLQRDILPGMIFIALRRRNGTPLSAGAGAGAGACCIVELFALI